MTPQEAKEVLTEAIKAHSQRAGIQFVKALDVAISALEKQIPKKPKVVFDEYSYFECGNCGEAIYCSCELKSHRCCLNCGQALDWSDTE